MVRVVEISNVKTGRRLCGSVVTIQKLPCLSNSLSRPTCYELYPTFIFSVTFTEQTDITYLLNDLWKTVTVMFATCGFHHNLLTVVILSVFSTLRLWLDLTECTGLWVSDTTFLLHFDSWSLSYKQTAVIITMPGEKAQMQNRNYQQVIDLLYLLYLVSSYLRFHSWDTNVWSLVTTLIHFLKDICKDTKDATHLPYAV